MNFWDQCYKTFIMTKSIVEKKIDAIFNIVWLICIFLDYPDIHNIPLINTHSNENVKIWLKIVFVILFYIWLRFIVSKAVKSLYTILFVWKD